MITLNVESHPKQLSNLPDLSMFGAFIEKVNFPGKKTSGWFTVVKITLANLTAGKLTLQFGSSQSFVMQLEK